MFYYRGKNVVERFQLQRSAAMESGPVVYQSVAVPSRLQYAGAFHDISCQFSGLFALTGNEVAVNGAQPLWDDDETPAKGVDDAQTLSNPILVCTQY